MRLINVHVNSAKNPQKTLRHTDPYPFRSSRYASAPKEQTFAEVGNSSSSGYMDVPGTTESSGYMVPTPVTGDTASATTGYMDVAPQGFDDDEEDV